MSRGCQGSAVTMCPALRIPGVGSGSGSFRGHGKFGPIARFAPGGETRNFAVAERAFVPGDSLSRSGAQTAKPA